MEHLLTIRSEGAFNAISPLNKLTALQLAIKRKWAAIANNLIDAGVRLLPRVVHATGQLEGCSETCISFL